MIKKRKNRETNGLASIMPMIDKGITPCYMITTVVPLSHYHDRDHDVIKVNPLDYGRDHWV